MYPAMFIKKKGTSFFCSSYLPLKKRRGTSAFLHCSSLPWKKRIACHYCHGFVHFTMKEHEAGEALLLLKTSTTLNNNIDSSAQDQDLNVNVNANANGNADADENYMVDLPPLDSLRDCIDECSRSFEKKLTGTDLNGNQNRLFLKKKHVTKSFLPMLREDEDLKVGIPVTAFDMFGNEFSMTFKMWSDKYYVLSGVGWNSFCRAHELRKEKDCITVWIFRHLVTNNLCFALAITRTDEGNLNGSPSSE